MENKRELEALVHCGLPTRLPGKADNVMLTAITLRGAALDGPQVGGIEAPERQADI